MSSRGQTRWGRRQVGAISPVCPSAADLTSVDRSRFWSTLSRSKVDRATVWITSWTAVAPVLRLFQLTLEASELIACVAHPVVTTD
jgi:hypothetical protein